MKSAAEALKLLQEGNERFVANVRGAEAILSQVRRADLVNVQEPFAVVLGCSDARVPAEIVFDRGLGDLFVIRVAGNIVAPSQIGSIEFAVERFGTQLVVVLGHTRCGAVDAAIDAVAGAAAGSTNLMSIVSRIRPTIAPLARSGAFGDRQALWSAGVRANVLASANQLRHGSPTLETLVASGGLTVAGAVYDLATGVVEFLDSGKA
jgi:carbonic anhydrase